jgi:hypothetical protein
VRLWRRRKDGRKEGRKEGKKERRKVSSASGGGVMNVVSVLVHQESAHATSRVGGGVMEVKVDLLVARVERLLEGQRKIQEDILWIKQQISESRSNPVAATPAIAIASPLLSQQLETTEADDPIDSISYDEIKSYLSPYFPAMENQLYQDISRTKFLSKSLDQTLHACILNFFNVKDLLNENSSLGTKQIIESFGFQRKKVISIYMKIFQSISVRNVDTSDLNSRLREKLRQNIRKISL